MTCEDDCYSSDVESVDANQVEDSDSVCLAPKHSSIKVITRESLLSAQKEDLQRVIELLSVREHNARTLLIHFRWDVEKLLAILVEKGESILFAQAGVPMLDRHHLAEPAVSFSCNICMEDVLKADATKMDCGHCFCNNCWTEHFIVKIKEGKSKRITCMSYKCSTICDESIIRNLVSRNHQDLAEKFDRFLLESYIEDNKMVKWCPSVPHCGNAIRVNDDDEVAEVECSCGLQFCFNCVSKAHSPCSCLMWQLWSKKCSDESENLSYIMVNTKFCPKCQKPTEKNGGCNLVVCICGQPFCWLCGGATGREHTWTSIAGHSCGRYKEDEEKTREQVKKAYYRYMHYYGRYKAHLDSLKEEYKLKESLKEKISFLEEKDSRLRDFSWVTNGMHRLFSSRRALLYSYPFAYYMFGDELFKGEMSDEEREIKQNLFEDQQQQLEGYVENLSKCLEAEFDDYNFDMIPDIRMRVVNLTVLTDSRCKKMYECIENELLGCLSYSTHCIATYKSRGIEKATELS